jgi:hypothetical protein
LPDGLPPVADELTAYVLGKSNTYVLSPAEETLLYQRYVQLSYHWNPANDWNSKFDTVVINRSDENYLQRCIPMNKYALGVALILLLTSCTIASSRSMPYDAWRLGFFAPDYMEVWIETADAYGSDGMVRMHAGSGTASIGYPRALRKEIPEVFRGDPKGWPEQVGWGAGKYVKGAALPKQIYVRWQSLVEPQIYHAWISISEATRESMLKGEKTLCPADGKWITDYRKAIVIGLAPGGIAKVWVTGPCLSPIEVTRVQAKVDRTGPYDGKSGGKYRPLSPTSKAYVEKFGVPYGSW